MYAVLKNDNAPAFSSAKRGSLWKQHEENMTEVAPAGRRPSAQSNDYLRSARSACNSTMLNPCGVVFFPVR
jgi:hypothetical protein